MRRRPWSATRSVRFSPSQTARRTDSNVFYVALLRCPPSLLPAGVITRFHSVYGRESFSLDTSRRAAPAASGSGGELCERPISCRCSFTVNRPSIYPFINPSIFSNHQMQAEGGRVSRGALSTVWDLPPNNSSTHTSLLPSFLPSFLPLHLNSAQNSSRPVILSIFLHPVRLSHGCQPIHTCPFHLLST